jgi:hypothetical protein
LEPLHGDASAKTGFEVLPLIFIRSEIEAPLITREVLPETYFLSVIMTADAGRTIFAVSSIMLM